MVGRVVLVHVNLGSTPRPSAECSGAYTEESSNGRTRSFGLRYVGSIPTSSAKSFWLMFRDRLMVGPQSLILKMQVRVLLPDPTVE